MPRHVGLRALTPITINQEAPPAGLFCMKLTVQHLHAITGDTRNVARKEGLVAFINDMAAQKSDIEVPHNLAQFLSEVITESGNLRRVRENMNYSAERLRKIFGKYFKTDAQAAQYARKPEKIANRVYANRMGNGSPQSGDGWKNRGAGYIQLTGHDNFVKMTAWARRLFPDCPDFATNPERLTDPKWLGLGALWYWVHRVPQRYIDAGNHEMVRRSVNGGLNGFSHKLKAYDKVALTLLGYPANGVTAFQKAAGFKPEQIDGVSGPMTRKALHHALLDKSKTKTSPAEFRRTAQRFEPTRLPAPVDHVPATPTAKRTPWWKRIFGGTS